MSKLLNKNKELKTSFQKIGFEFEREQVHKQSTQECTYDDSDSEDEALFAVEVEFDGTNIETRTKPFSGKTGDKVSAAIRLNYITNRLMLKRSFGRLRSYKNRKSYRKAEENIFGVTCQSEKVFKRERTPDFNGREYNSTMFTSLTDIDDLGLKKTQSGKLHKRHSFKSQLQLGKIIQNIVKSDFKMRSSLDSSPESNQHSLKEKNLIDFDINELDLEEEDPDIDLFPSKQHSVERKSVDERRVSPIKNFSMLKKLQLPESVRATGQSSIINNHTASTRKKKSFTWKPESTTFPSI